MDAVEKELLRGEVDALVAALARERHRHVAGIDAAPALVEAFQARGRAAHRDTVKALQADGEAELARRVAALRVERVQAPQEEAWRAAEAAARGAGPDGAIAVHSAELALCRERDRDRRLALGRAAAEAAALPSREEAVETRARARAEVGLAPEWERVLEADALLAATDDAYRDVLAWLARREAGLAPGPRGDLERADLLFVLALRGWDGLFPPGMLALELRRALASLGLDAGRVQVDEGERPAQWPGAHVHETRVSLRRQGGAADWLGLFDAVGQAVAAASAPAHRRIAAATFTFGELLSGLLLDRGWLAARLGVDRSRAGDLVRALALRQLFRLRARAAALRVATEVERGTTGAAWHRAYRDAMALATLAAWPSSLAARDADADRAAAALSGAARAARLRARLVERLDEDWWRNPRAAEAVGSVLAAGGATGEDEPALREGTAPLVAAMQ